MLHRSMCRAAVTVSPVKAIRSSLGYNLNYVDGSRFYNDPREVAGSLHSTYQSPFASRGVDGPSRIHLECTVQLLRLRRRRAFGRAVLQHSESGAAAPVNVVACNSPALAGLQTGLTLPASGETCSRDLPRQCRHARVPLRILSGNSSKRWPGFAPAVGLRSRT